jgi:hypothetical protein
VGTVIATFVLFVAGFIFSGFTVGLIMSTAVLGAGGGLTFIKQSKGLYSKKDDKGVFIFARSIGGQSVTLWFQRFALCKRKGNGRIELSIREL